MTLSILLFTACFGTKPEDTATSAVATSSCEQAREEFYSFARSLLEDLDYKSCTSSDECDGGYCDDICGVSCYSLTANTATYDQIYDQLREFEAENCDACVGYAYEIYPEPETEPAWCEEGECR